MASQLSTPTTLCAGTHSELTTRDGRGAGHMLGSRESPAVSPPPPAKLGFTFQFCCESGEVQADPGSVLPGWRSGRAGLKACGWDWGGGLSLLEPQPPGSVCLSAEGPSGTLLTPSKGQANSPRTCTFFSFFTVFYVLNLVAWDLFH